MHKLLWDFEIQTDYLISARRPHLAKDLKKQQQWNMDVTVVPIVIGVLSSHQKNE